MLDSQTTDSQWLDSFVAGSQSRSASPPVRVDAPSRELIADPIPPIIEPERTGEFHVPEYWPQSSGPDRLNRYSVAMDSTVFTQPMPFV